MPGRFPLTAIALTNDPFCEDGFCGEAAAPPFDPTLYRYVRWNGIIYGRTAGIFGGTGTRTRVTSWARFIPGCTLNWIGIGGGPWVGSHSLTKGDINAFFGNENATAAGFTFRRLNPNTNNLASISGEYPQTVPPLIGDGTVIIWFQGNYEFTNTDFIDNIFPGPDVVPDVAWPGVITAGFANSGTTFDPFDPCRNIDNC